MRSEYVVKEELVDQFYGNANTATLLDYQKNGIPVEDLKNMERVYKEAGLDIYAWLEKL